MGLGYVSNPTGYCDPILVRHHQLGRALRFTEFPRDFQLYPRDSTGYGHVRIEGYDAPNGMQYDSILVEVLRNDTLVGFQVCAFNNGSGNAAFSLQFQQPAICANYHYRAIGIHTGVHYPEVEACDVVAGDAYIITGQSNATANWFPDRQNGVAGAYGDHPNGFVRNFGLVNAYDTVYAWRKESNGDFPLADFAVGEWGLVMGDHIVDHFGVPVAILNGGLLGISIDSMLPNPSNHLDISRSYGKFLARAAHSGLKDQFRGLIFFQGETDGGIGYFHSTADELAKFDSLRAAWNVDFPGRQKNYLFQIRPGAFWMGATLQSCLAIEEAHRMIPDLYPDFELMSTTGMNHDSTHYYYVHGYERAGEDIFRLVARDFYGAAPLSCITPPNVATAYFSNATKTEVTLEMREPYDALSWFPGWENDFILESSLSVHVVSGSAQGNKVILQLNQAPLPTCTGISHASHAGGAACAVKNQRGIGMVSFYNVSLGGPGTGAEDPNPFEIKALPNPSGGKLWLQVEGESIGDLQLQWYGCDGKQLSSSKIDGDRLEPYCLLEVPSASGLYFLKVRNRQDIEHVLRIVRL